MQVVDPADCKPPAETRWANARVRMKELLEKDAEFAEGCKRALATPDPTDAEWLASLNERGFSEQAFVEHYGAALAEEVQSQLSG